MVTVDGSAVANPQNVIVPVGTPIQDVLNFVGLKCEPKKVQEEGTGSSASLVSKARTALVFFITGASREGPDVLTPPTASSSALRTTSPSA